MSCSLCEEPTHRSLVIPSDEDPPALGQKDQRGVRIVRFCKAHWARLRTFLPN